eukprot:UN24507
MECGIFIDRESLLEKKQARVVVRPGLLLNEIPVSVENMKNAQLTIETSDYGDLKTKRTVNLDLKDNEESVYTFTVPTELRSVEIYLESMVQTCTGEETLTNRECFRVNDIDKTNALADLHLIPAGSKGYVLAVLGKNGEPYKGVVVDIELSQRFFQKKLKYVLQTDDNGQIHLGFLFDVETLEATARSDLVYQGDDEDTKHKWFLLNDQVNVPSIVNVNKGQTVRIPFMATKDSPKIDVYDVGFVRKFKNVSYKDSYIEIKGLPKGIFKCFIRDVQSAEVLIHVSKGSVVDNHIVTDGRLLELSEERPLQITEVKGTR